MNNQPIETFCGFKVMTAKIWFEECSSFGIGNWKSPEQHSVVGRPNDFYVWVRTTKAPRGRNSHWVRGNLSMYNRLRAAFNARNRVEFVELVVEILNTEPVELRRKYG